MLLEQSLDKIFKIGLIVSPLKKGKKSMIHTIIPYLSICKASMISKFRTVPVGN